jgi:uncharacterized membrane protein YdbT with pleckstrin-like domain
LNFAISDALIPAKELEMNTRLIVGAIIFLPVMGILFALVQAFLPILPGTAHPVGAYPVVLGIAVILAIPAAWWLSGVMMRSRFANRRSREDAPPALRYDKGRDERPASALRNGNGDHGSDGNGSSRTG